MELSGLAVGQYTVEVSAQAPVLAAVWQTTGFGEGSDFAWYTAAPPVSAPSLFAAPPGPAPVLALANSTDEAITELTATLPERGAEVAGIGLCGQMHGLTPLDAEGHVLRPAILWNDQRSAPQCTRITELAGGADGLLQLTGNRMLPGYTGGKIAWMRDNGLIDALPAPSSLLSNDYLAGTIPE